MSRLTRHVGAALAMSIVLLASCAGEYGTDTSYEAGLQPGDADALMAPIERLVRQTVKPGSGAIAVATPPSGASAISPQLRADLTQEGYQVAAPDDAAKHLLGYMITPVADQMLLRVFLDQLDGAQLYARDASGRLQPSGPLAVRRSDG
ncbi:hypothetical protein [Lichenicoccus roseus]|uniref:Conjugal transfer protein TrbH n=1 Tax=Lichenicoccus roseus TaxID=2683649 RepID=A0A5R9J3V0_9PROT|nr:hypothetical protein [Lichenicoccus roseus]TLU71177.1 hypothetical protein FE263_18580 [Lichenicoccus roseus]